MKKTFLPLVLSFAWLASSQAALACHHHARAHHAKRHVVSTPQYAVPFQASYQYAPQYTPPLVFMQSPQSYTAAAPKQESWQERVYRQRSERSD